MHGCPGQSHVPSLPGPRGKATWKQLTVLRKVAGDEIALVRGVPGMICPPGGAGYEGFCYQLFDAPEEIDAQA